MSLACVKYLPQCLHHKAGTRYIFAVTNKYFNGLPAPQKFLKGLGSELTVDRLHTDEYSVLAFFTPSKGSEMLITKLLETSPFPGFQNATHDSPYLPPAFWEAPSASFVGFFSFL